MGARTQKAEKGLRKTTSLTKTLTKAVAGLAAGYLSVAAASRAIAKVNEQFISIDRFAKRSASLKLPIKEIQAFGLAAELTGTNFEIVAKALSVMQRRASEAKVGLSTAVRPLEQLGINIERFNKLDTTSQFKLIADRLSNVALQTDKARIAQELFGRAGAELIPLLNQGSTAIDEATKFLKKHNLEISGFDARRIEQANDRWVEMKKVLEGVYRIVAIEVAPTMIQFATEATNAFSKLVRVTKTLAVVLEQVGLNTQRALVEMGLVNEQLAQARQTGSTGLNIGVNIRTTEIEKATDKVGAVMDELTAKMEDRAKRLIESLKSPLDKLRDRFQGIRELVKGGFISPDIASQAVNKFFDEFKKRVQSSITETPANTSTTIKGSQEDLAARFGRTLKDNRNEERRIANATEEANSLLEEIRDGLKERKPKQPINANLGG